MEFWFIYFCFFSIWNRFGVFEVLDNFLYRKNGLGGGKEYGRKDGKEERMKEGKKDGVDCRYKFLVLR